MVSCCTSDAPCRYNREAQSISSELFARSRSRMGAIGWPFCLGRIARLLLTAAGVPLVWMAFNLVGLRRCRVDSLACHLGTPWLVVDEREGTVNRAAGMKPSVLCKCCLL